MVASVRKGKSRKPGLYLDNEHHSVSVRRIDNGYVVAMTKASGDSYKSTEKYHESRPNIDIQSIPRLDAKSTESKVTVKALRTAAGIKKVKDT